jgi:hypothetical protein
VLSASQTHNRANMGMSSDDSMTAFAAVASLTAAVNRDAASAYSIDGFRTHGRAERHRRHRLRLPVRGTRSTEDRVLDTGRYATCALGVGGITLADTTGMANPRQVARLVRRVLERVPAEALTLHFHNTRGLGLANVLAAYEAGARRFDAALGGLGGCPFAPGASGNICTEDLVNMCDEMGIRHRHRPAAADRDCRAACPQLRGPRDVRGRWPRPAAIATCTRHRHRYRQRGRRNRQRPESPPHHPFNTHSRTPRSAGVRRLTMQSDLGTVAAGNVGRHQGGTRRSRRSSARPPGA